MKNFSAEFIAKKSLSYYESRSNNIIREVQVEINNAAERGHFRVTLSDDLLDKTDYSCDLDCHIEVRQGHIWENVVEVKFYAVDELAEVKFEVKIAKFSVPIISAKCYIKALTGELS